MVEINSEHLEVGSGGSPYDDAVGSDTYRPDSFEWFPDSESAGSGNPDGWLGLLSHIPLLQGASGEAEDEEIWDEQEEALTAPLERGCAPRPKFDRIVNFRSSAEDLFIWSQRVCGHRPAVAANGIDWQGCREN